MPLRVLVGVGFVVTRDRPRGLSGGRLVAEVPVNRVEQLHGLLVGPDGVDEDGEECEAGEEDQALREHHMPVNGVPVAPAHPPHVVGQHHAAVKHVDHHPLVGLPED